MRQTGKATCTAPHTCARVYLEAWRKGLAGRDQHGCTQSSLPPPWATDPRNHRD